MTTTRRLFRFVPLLVVLLALLAPSAFADGNNGVVDETPQKGANNLQIDKIDATNDKQVSLQFTWNGDVSKLSSLTVRENGSQVTNSSPQLLTDIGVKRATVLVLDQSGSMVTNGGLATSVTKMKELVADASAGDQFGLVTFGSQSSVAQDMTPDKGLINKALDSLKPDPKAHTAMWDGVVSAAAMLNALPKFQHNIILVTDGADDSSGSSAAQARGAVIGNGANNGATVFAMGVTQEGQLDKSGISKLVGSAGGRFFVTAKAKNISAAFDQMTTALKNQYVLSFAPLPKATGRNTINLSIGGFTAPASFTLGGVQSGTSALSPQYAPAPSGPAFFRTTGGLVLGLLLIGVALTLVIYVALQLVTSRQSALDAALSPYAEGYTVGGGSSADDQDTGLAQTALLQRAVAMTESFAERQGFLDTVEHKLELAEIPLKAAEVLLIWVFAIILLGVLGFVLGGIVVALVLVAVAILFGPAFLDMKARMRQKKFEAQLPDMLTLLAGALRAGFSLMQAVDAVSVEVQDPMGKELRRVVSESRLGRDLEDALDDTAERTGSSDFAWAVMAIRIQREVGGNLSELLMTVAETMVQRERLRREVRALTAEGRISAIILGFLPPGIGVVMYIMNPTYMNPLFHDILGQIMLGLSVVGMIIGFLWMRKVIQIEI